MLMKHVWWLYLMPIHLIKIMIRINKRLGEMTDWCIPLCVNVFLVSNATRLYLSTIYSRLWDINISYYAAWIMYSIIPNMKRIIRTPLPYRSFQFTFAFKPHMWRVTLLFPSNIIFVLLLCDYYTPYCVCRHAWQLVSSCYFMNT